jgi:hypothetical protein
MKNWLAVAVLTLATTLAFAQEQDETPPSAAPPSTAEERARAVEVTKKVEAEPLNPRYRSDRDWLLLWIEKIPDITVPICQDLLPVASKGQEPYKYANELRWQTIASSAEFLIEHPNDKDNDFAINEAAVEGALVAYQNILKSRPRAHWTSLDDLLEKQKAGALQDWVKTQTFHCLDSGNNLVASFEFH